MAQARQGAPLPESRRRPDWRTGPNVSRGGKLIDVEVMDSIIGGGTIDGSTIATSTLTEESWAAPSLQNSWADLGSPSQTARYRKDMNGIVHVQGTIASGTTTVGTLIFTLPAGYRPAATLQIVVLAQSGLAHVDVASDGTVKVGSGFSATWTTITFSFAT